MGSCNFHPCYINSGRRRMTYLSNLWVVVVVRYQSLLYINSTICTLKFGLDLKEDLIISGVSIHSIYDLTLDRHVHLGKKHVHDSNHLCMVFLKKRSLILRAFINVKQHVEGVPSSVLNSTCVTLSCGLICRLSICLFLQVEACVHLARCVEIAKHDMSCLRTCFLW